MMKKIIICIFLAMSSCGLLKKQNAVNLELNIIPSGGGDTGYSVNVRDDTLKVKLMSIGSIKDSIVMKEVMKEKSLILSSSQSDKLNEILDNIEPGYKINKEVFILDTWVYTIKLNNKEIANFNSKSLLENTVDEKLKKLKVLIRYLIRLSPLNIKLNDFS